MGEEQAKKKGAGQFHWREGNKETKAEKNRHLGREATSKRIPESRFVKEDMPAGDSGEGAQTRHFHH